MNKKYRKNCGIIIAAGILISAMFIIYPSEKVNAGSYNGEDLALAVLANQSTFISSSYTDTDQSGHRQAAVLSSLGTMIPTDGSNFILLSTGIAGNNPVTTDEQEPGDERGSWFSGGKYGHPRDSATLTMNLEVPPFMHYIYYDVQFLSSEYPEYVGSQYNDKLTITVDSPSQGVSTYVFDVNSGYFVFDSNSIPGTGFDIFARSGLPGGVDWVDTTPRKPGADAGASDVVPIGGASHPVAPYEQITVTFNIKDTGDNLFDSAAFIDNLMFSGYAKTDIIARKTYDDINDEPVECGDTINYTIRISNTGAADQHNNPGNEFEDILPKNITYIQNSVYSNFGTAEYIQQDNKIVWNGEIPSESTILINFEVTIDEGVANGTIISNQGIVNWDSDEDLINDKVEFTDDPYIDDGVDLDNDSDTDDDDPTNITVIAFEPPETITEDFSDDTPGSFASQSYFGRNWFVTSNGLVGSKFEVVSGYHYSTDNAFKTKIRASGSPQFWNYSLSELNSDISWWELWFTCGNASEQSDLYLDFKNSNGVNIARLKLEYVQMGTNPPTDWVAQLYYWSPSTEWTKLNSDYIGGYIYNDWYKIKIEKNGENLINYSLYRNNQGLVDFITDQKLSEPFSDLNRIEWSNTKNPIVCPMFFWDEHNIGLV